MNYSKQNLKRVIDAFLKQNQTILEIAESERKPLDQRTLEPLAQSIWDLRHFAEELISRKPDESTFYNAKIIKELTDEGIELDMESKPRVSLIQAADDVKKYHKIECLNSIIKAMIEDPSLSEVLIENLEEMSHDLAA